MNSSMTKKSGKSAEYSKVSGKKAVVALLLGGSIFSSAAQAQTEQMSSSNGITDIIVTPQKRAESVQDPPVSISVMGAEALETRGITNIMDLTSGAVPSLRTTPIAGLSAAANIGCPSSEHSAHVAA